MVAGKIFGNGARGDVFQGHAGAVEGAQVGAEVAQVAAEDGLTAAREQAGQAFQQVDVVALDVPGAAAHLGGVGERGRVAEDQVPPVARPHLPFDPVQHVVAHVMVLRTGESVGLHVALGPVQIGVGEVHGDGLGGAAVRRIAGGRARIGKEVEEAAGGELAHPLAHETARRAVVEEDAGIQVAGKVHLKGEAAFPDGNAAHLAPRILPSVLRAAAGLQAGAREHVLRIYVQDARCQGEHVLHAGAGDLGVDGAGRRVLGHHQPASRHAGPVLALVQVYSCSVVG